jgi:hypothetical protein
MVSPDGKLGIAFVAFAVLQTVLPIIVQKMTRAIVYSHVLHGAIAACMGIAIVVGLLQAMHRSFSSVAIVLFYIGLALLGAFDIWINRAIEASC